MHSKGEGLKVGGGEKNLMHLNVCFPTELNEKWCI